MEWLASYALAIGSALLAALWAAVGIVVRQRAIREGAANPEDSGAIVTSWVRQPSWWAGTLGAVGGYVFQALALAHGSLLLVQPLLVTSLLFVLPLGARFSNQLLTVPAPDLLVALAVTVTVLQQSAFHAGALQASVPIMLVGEPVVAVLLGVVVLGEHLVVRGGGGVVLALAVTAMTAATIALGRDSASTTTQVVDTVAPASSASGRPA